ncbi:MAG: hypothetical protein P4L69_23910 [Desulfosporosinus sp.]|nr:hypothetical protein [Desulfosporosinus sp.]
MTKKAYDYLLTISGVICCYAMIKSFFFIQTRPVRTDVIQGIFVGFGLALATAKITAKLKSTKVNGWSTLFRLSVPATLTDVSYVPTYSHSYQSNGKLLYRVVPVPDAIQKIKDGTEPFLTAQDLPTLEQVFDQTSKMLGTGFRCTSLSDHFPLPIKRAL